MLLDYLETGGDLKKMAGSIGRKTGRKKAEKVSPEDEKSKTGGSDPTDLMV
jgi:hypothetical protein